MNARTQAAEGAPEKQAGPKGRVLLVDDEPFIVAAFTRMLKLHGYDVEGVSDGLRALERVLQGDFDVVVSDILMPHMDGMTLLKRLREKDLDVPVVLLTGVPTLDTAMKAVEYGAMRYLTKPVDPEDVLQVVGQATRLRKLAAVRREAAVHLGSAPGREVGDLAGVEARFDQAMRSLWIAFQPVIQFSAGKVWGYEALVRSTEPTMRTPGALFDAADRLDLLHHLGRAIRRRVAAAVPRAPSSSMILVNLHPMDLLDDELFDRAAPLSRFAPRVILEVTERASLEKVGSDLRKRVEGLREMGYRIALDDIGAGYAGLTSFTQLEPEVVKLDMVFARGVDTDHTKQQLVKSLVSMCGGLYVQVIAEGVETEDERDMLVSLGCDLLQGFLFARPDRSFPMPKL